MTHTAYATRTLRPFPPRNRRAIAAATFWSLGGVVLAVPNVFAVHCWSALAAGTSEWSDLLFRRPDDAKWALAVGCILFASWGSLAALREARRIFGARRWRARGPGLRVLSMVALGWLPAAMWIAHRGLTG